MWRSQAAGLPHYPARGTRIYFVTRRSTATTRNRARFRTSIAAALVVASLLPLAAAAQVAENTLTVRLRQVFAEINRGHIDLNGNGSLDQTDDLNERVPESTLTDALVQGAEILDFVFDNVVFLSLAQLQGVQQTVSAAAGVIPELISIRYSAQLADAIETKQDQLARGVFSPVALREAHARMTAFATTYKRQDRHDEGEFATARDGLLAVVAQGFPLPNTIANEDRDILVTLMMHTVQGGNGSARAWRATRRGIGEPTDQSYPCRRRESSGARAEGGGDLGAGLDWQLPGDDGVAGRVPEQSDRFDCASGAARDRPRRRPRVGRAGCQRVARHVARRRIGCSCNHDHRGRAGSRGRLDPERAA